MLRHYRKLPDNYDPWRRLLAAITLRAVYDICTPSLRLTDQDQASAVSFLRDRGVQDLMQDMGVSVPWQAIEQLVIGG
jgi:hypothetical protein